MKSIVDSDSARHSPAWRYEQVNKLYGRKNVRPADLEGIDPLARALYDLGADSLPRVMTKKKQDWYKSVQTAYTMYIRTNPFGGQRWLTEAFLLSGASNEEIAEEFKTLPVVIQIFHDLFFDVRSYLDSPSLIQDRVMAPALKADQRRMHTTYIWKAIAYRFGYLAARSYMSNGHYKGASSEVHAWLEGMTEHAVVATAAAITRDPLFFKEENGCTLVMKVADKIATKKAAAGANGTPLTEQGDSLFQTFTTAYLSTEEDRMTLFKQTFDPIEGGVAISMKEPLAEQVDILSVDASTV